ncbi:MAG: tRNA pseudouridine(13) synthase TruD [archaeon]|jgi:tRNA pseudouridine13 synthase
MEPIFVTTTEALGGKIKQRYSDFIVEEVLIDGRICQVKKFDKAFGERKEELEKIIVPASNGKEQLLLDLEKINQDTNFVFARLARGLNVSKKRIGYAGLKDKRGITCQRISLYGPDPKRVERFGFRGIELRNPEWSDKRIELGELKGNNFVLTIRGIEKSEDEIKKIISEFAEQAKEGLPNFFGNQRFGGKREITHRVGKLLLAEKFEEAVMLYLTETYSEEKEELRNARINLANTNNFSDALKQFPFLDARSEIAMLNHLVNNPKDFAGAFGKLPKKIRYLFVHAYQSHIFNKIIEERLLQFGKKGLDVIEGDELIEGEPAALLPGFESKFAEGKAGEIEQKILADEGVDFRTFRVGGMSELSSKGSRKNIVLRPENFNLIETGADEFNEGKRFAKVSFFLSKGNYATTIMRELLKEEIF